MLRLIFLKLWPALIPIALYLLWYAYKRRKYRETGEVIRVLDGPWGKTLLASLLIAATLMIGYRVGHTPEGPAAYQPAQVVDGEIVDGEMIRGGDE